MGTCPPQMLKNVHFWKRFSSIWCILLSKNWTEFSTHLCHLIYKICHHVLKLNFFFLLFLFLSSSIFLSSFPPSPFPLFPFYFPSLLSSFLSSFFASENSPKIFTQPAPWLRLVYIHVVCTKTNTNLFWGGHQKRW